MSAKFLPDGLVRLRAVCVRVRAWCLRLALGLMLGACQGSQPVILTNPPLEVPLAWQSAAMLERDFPPLAPNFEARAEGHQLLSNDIRLTPEFVKRFGTTSLIGADAGGNPSRDRWTISEAEPEGDSPRYTLVLQSVRDGFERQVTILVDERLRMLSFESRYTRLLARGSDTRFVVSRRDHDEKGEPGYRTSRGGDVRFERSIQPLVVEDCLPLLLWMMPEGPINATISCFGPAYSRIFDCQLIQRPSRLGGERALVVLDPRSPFGDTLTAVIRSGSGPEWVSNSAGYRFVAVAADRSDRVEHWLKLLDHERDRLYFNGQTLYSRLRPDGTELTEADPPEQSWLSIPALPLDLRVSGQLSTRATLLATLVDGASHAAEVNPVPSPTPVSGSNPDLRRLQLSLDYVVEGTTLRSHALAVYASHAAETRLTGWELKELEVDGKPAVRLDLAAPPPQGRGGSGLHHVYLFLDAESSLVRVHFTFASPGRWLRELDQTINTIRFTRGPTLK